MGWPQVAAVGIGLVANYLLKGKQKKGKTPSYAETPLSVRGSYVRYLHGRRLIKDPVVTWAGDRASKQEEVDGGGGKGGGKKAKSTVFYESGMHVLAVGPGRQLTRIRQSGEVIFEGPITRASHPSGSSITLGKEGEFEIYWGESEQPVSSFLADASRVGIATAYPWVMYILWREKRLGSSPTWPALEYDIEVDVNESELGNTPSWIPVEKSISPTSGGGHNIVNNVAGPPGVNYFDVRRDLGGILYTGDLSQVYPAGQVVDVTQQTSPTPFTTGSYYVLKSEYIPGLGGEAAPPFTDVQRVYLNCFVDQVSDGGNPFTFGFKGFLTPIQFIEPLDLEPSPEGANLIHTIYERLFAPMPRGMELDKSEWDLQAFAAAASLLDVEKLPGSVDGGVDGASCEELIVQIQGDMGFFICLDPRTGKYRLKELRTQTTPVPAIPNHAENDQFPQMDSLLKPKNADLLAFTYEESSQNFTEVPVMIDDDGTASVLKHNKAKAIQMPTVIDQETAFKVAYRRAQEEQAQMVSGKVISSRESRFLIPGQAFSTSSIPFTLMAMALGPREDSAMSEVAYVKHAYGATSTSFDPEFQFPAANQAVIPQPDTLFYAYEIPDSQSPDKIRLIVPRQRASAATVGARIYLSTDDVTYEQVAIQNTIQVGGILQSNFQAGSKNHLEQGPIFYAVTFDNVDLDMDTIPDLSGDHAGWRRGRIKVVFRDTTGQPEICFVRKITNLGPDGFGDNQFRLDGLLRARMGTAQQAHTGSFTNLLIIVDDNCQVIEHPALIPKQVIYIKTQPFTDLNAVSLDQITPHQMTLYGKGVVPQAPMSLRTVNKRNDFATGAAVPLRWSYRSTLVPNTGAGDQPAGAPVGPGPVRGTFALRIYSTGLVLKATISGLTSPNYTIPNADLVTMFGGSEPSAFKADVINELAGFDSLPTATITVTRV